MHRRDLLKLIAAATGCALVGTERALAAPAAGAAFSAHDIAMLDEIAETIIPRTDTPGAKDAGVGPFIARYAHTCYEPAQLRSLQQGIGNIEAAMRAQSRVGFRQASPAQRHALLSDLDREAKQQANDPARPAPHYFTLMKQLTLLGFFTSEPGSTRVLRYRPVPGKYRGCVPYKKGESSWA
ncbi:gluconate 2-dehydrogenase subunit 3 family protein [Massilia terrae]|uniref:Gluconate 2-dehydrogenase subunit 3 family protein n=1 Tax=Massilia terrae TaxID=1811224 RepID=A0ABT2CV98_9BURK|nr:gluconate 2-dehydrogenase subunit 3 family protein [Massilia terrae]MCS0657125.1 gluconate 2-dehydrogenase subunit 3 family protein [Massilia terrae]